MDQTINGHTYRIGKIDARSQFHIVRRLAPIFGELAPALRGGSSDALASLPAITAAFAKLSDEDMDYCLFGLLRVVVRQQPNGLGWGPVCAAGNVLAYDDITMPVMLQIAWASLSENMSGFFAALPSDLRGALQPPSGPSAG